MPFRVILTLTAWSAFSSTTHLSYSRLSSKRKIGSVKVVAFNENDRTLKGIQDGRGGPIARTPTCTATSRWNTWLVFTKGRIRQTRLRDQWRSPLWTIAEKGALQAQADLSVSVGVVLPPAESRIKIESRFADPQGRWHCGQPH